MLGLKLAGVPETAEYEEGKISGGQKV